MNSPCDKARRAHFAPLSVQISSENPRILPKDILRPNHLAATFLSRFALFYQCNTLHALALIY